MNGWLQVMVNGLIAVGASGGLWAYLQHKDSIRNQTNRLLRGLAYDKIVSQGLMYIERGWITKDEYEEYRLYLYDPYKALGGNGVTERVMAEVSSLPLLPRSKYAQVLNEAKGRQSENELSSIVIPAEELLS